MLCFLGWFFIAVVVVALLKIFEFFEVVWPVFIWTAFVALGCLIIETCM